jgi:hypothetical protein
MSRRGDSRLVGRRVEVGSIEARAKTFRLDARTRLLRCSTTVTWFNCRVEVTDQVTNEPSHQVTGPTSQVQLTQKTLLCSLSTLNFAVSATAITAITPA